MKVKYIGKVVFNVDGKVLIPGEVYDISEKSVKTFYMLFEEIKAMPAPKPEPKPEVQPEPEPESKSKSRAKASK